jgi:hypothetical protein
MSRGKEGIPNVRAKCRDWLVQIYGRKGNRVGLCGRANLYIDYN